MDILVSLSQVLLYVCLSILLGTFILNVVPEKLRPAFFVPPKWLIFSSAVIPLLTFVPVLYIILYISPQLGFMRAIDFVITQYTIGIAWAFSFLLSSFLIFVIMISHRDNKLGRASINVFSIFITLGIIVTIAWASHASAVNITLGMISDSIHLIAVSIWVGVVLVVAWFSTNTENWDKFLSWFSIVAISCLGATAISGFLLLEVLVEDYVDSWLVSYGQGLFLKHLFILPLLFYAAMNGLFVKYKLSKDINYNPLKGVTVVSIILLSIFTLAAFFSQSSPPHGSFIEEEAISPLFKLLHDVTGQVGGLQFVSNGIAIAFVFGSMVLFGLNIFAYLKKAPIWLLYLLVVLFISCLYITFMLSVTIK